MFLEKRSPKIMLYRPNGLIKILNNISLKNLIKITFDNFSSFDYDVADLFYVDTLNLSFSNKILFIDSLLQKSDKYNFKLIFYDYTDIFRSISVKINKALIAPEAVSFDIFDACNTECIYCWTHSFLNKRNITYGAMGFDQFKKIISDLVLHGLEWVEMSGVGEPFMHPKILDMLEYVVSKGLGVYVYTNGLLLNEDIIFRLVKLNVGLRINMSSHNYVIYSIIHPEIDELKYLRFIELLSLYGKLQKNKGGDFIFSTENVICNFNYNYISEIISLSKRIGCNEAIFNVISSTEETDTISIKNFDVLSSNLDNCDTLGLKTNLDELKISIKNKSSSLSVPCIYYWYYARIFVDGSIMPCTEFPRFVDLTYVDSDVLNSISFLRMYRLGIYPFSLIWMSEQMNLLRSHIFSEDKVTIPCCKKCVHVTNNIGFFKKLNC